MQKCIMNKKSKLKEGTVYNSLCVNACALNGYILKGWPFSSLTLPVSLDQNNVHILQILRI